MIGSSPSAVKVDTAAAPPVERELVFDIAKRGLLVAPAIIAIAAVARGGAGAASATVAVVIVILNLALSGAILSWAARTSLNLLMIAALGGFLLGLGLGGGIIAMMR